VESLSIIEDFNIVGNILFGFIPGRIDLTFITLADFPVEGGAG
jgi:hypothetical protein